MTDKRIIIDGIDVSGCVYYADGKCTNSHMIQSNCKNVAVCYYKEYKRKEQECEELRKANDEKNELLAKLGCPTIATARRKVFCLQEQLDQLKAENDELKEEKQGLIKDWEEKKNLAYEIACKNEKLKQTLTEIKEIANKKVIWCLGGDRYCNSCKTICDEYKILQKISECEVE